MKKFIIIAAVSCLLNTLHAQETKKDSTISASNLTKDSALSKAEKTGIYIEVKNGKLMYTDKGNQTLLQKEMPLKNGDVIKLNGTVKTANGETIQLKDGDRVYENGLLIKRT